MNVLLCIKPTKKTIFWDIEQSLLKTFHWWIAFVDVLKKFANIPAWPGEKIIQKSKVYQNTAIPKISEKYEKYTFR